MPVDSVLKDWEISCRGNNKCTIQRKNILPVLQQNPVTFSVPVKTVGIKEISPSG